MKVAVVVYVDSAIEDAQTGTLCRPMESDACGFLIRDEPGYVTLSREIMGEEYRGQLSIPREAIRRFEVATEANGATKEAAMPFKSRKQMKAMFAKGGKSAKVARQWARKYGVPGGRKGGGKKGKR